MNAGIWFVLTIILGLNTVTLLFISGHLSNIYATLSYIASIYARRNND